MISATSLLSAPLMVIGMCLPLFSGNSLPEQKDPPRIFVHTRGTAEPTIESWTEDGVVHFRDCGSGKFFKARANGLEELSLPQPALPLNKKGIVKFRRGEWWFLNPERGQREEDLFSSLYRYDVAEKQWVLVRDLDIRASNFEPLADGQVLLVGVFSRKPDRYSLSALLTKSGFIERLFAVSGG